MTKTAVMKALLTVPAVSDGTAMVSDSTSGVPTWWNLGEHLAGEDDQERALRMAVDGGWRVSGGSTWTEDAEAGRSRILIERDA